MKLIWEHSINLTVVPEPIGWDAVKFTLQRDAQYSGLENILSDSITFDGLGGLIIKNAYAIRGIDAALDYRVRYSCDGGLTYSTQFNGIINCVTYKEVNNEVTAKIEPSGFHRKVKNRLDVPVNLMSNTSMGGEAMSSISAFDLGMHSKGLVFTSTFEQDATRLSYAKVGSGVVLGDHIAYPFLAVVSELQETMSATAFEPGDAYPLVYSGLTYPTGISSRTINITGRLKFDISWYAVFFELCIRIKDSSGGDVGNITLASFSLDEITPQSTSIDLDVNETVTLAADQYLNLFFDIIFPSVSGPVPNIGWTFSTDSNLLLTEESLAPPSESKAFLLHEVFAKVSESMTDIQDSFKSDFFGRTNSSPRTYDSNGCGAWIALTNGLNIRNMLDKDGNLFPVIVSFNDLFEACNAVWNLGMRIEVDENGKEFIRVEPKEYFYNQTSVITLSNVANIETTPAIDLIYNEFECGYEKSNLNTGGLNGIDEFNSKRNYSLPIVKAKKKLSAVCKFIASGYVIEQTRRVKYVETASEDFETDNNLFFICTNISTVTSDLYTTPPTSTTYEAGTVSERDENFININNLVSPTTPYNLRISPARMLTKWYKILSSAMYYSVSPEVKFISGTGNYQEQDEQSDSCNTYDGVIEQNQDFTSTGIIGSDNDPVYIPNYINFDFPLSWPDFKIIEANSEMALQFSCNGTIRRGFVKHIEMEPNAEGGPATLKLLEAPGCVDGEFDPDEFSIAFNIGGC